MRIGQLAADCGVTAKTIRFYEQAGLLPEPARTPTGYRDYPPASGTRLRFIRTAQAAGLSLAEIAGVLAVRDRGQPPCAHVATLIDTHLADIRDRIAALHAAHAELPQLADRAAALDPAECSGTDEICHILAPDKG